MSDFLTVFPQYLLPKQLLTQLAGRFARCESGALTQWAITKFIAHYQVNMREAKDSDPKSYKTFNDFFTRELKPSARPLAQADFVCPVDGTISQLGEIKQNQILQAKEHFYSTQSLLGADLELAQQLENGQFATIYLSPKDYHRIHMPHSGRLLRMVYVPGDLFSVNPATARGVPNLFARNERVICVFESINTKQEKYQWVLVLVGATIVGSMATVWHGVVNPPRSKEIRVWDYNAPNSEPIHLEKGAEMGRFLLGSTVVLLFPKNTLNFHSQWSANRVVCMGEAMSESFKNQ